MSDASSVATRDVSCPPAGTTARAVRELDRIAAVRPDLGVARHAVQDVADHLAGRVPTPGSPYAAHPEETEETQP